MIRFWEWLESLSDGRNDLLLVGVASYGSTVPYMEHEQRPLLAGRVLDSECCFLVLVSSFLYQSFEYIFGNEVSPLFHYMHTVFMLGWNLLENIPVHII